MANQNAWMNANRVKRNTYRNDNEETAYEKFVKAKAEAQKANYEKRQYEQAQKQNVYGALKDTVANVAKGKPQSKYASDILQNDAMKNQKRREEINRAVKSSQKGLQKAQQNLADYDESVRLHQMYNPNKLDQQTYADIKTVLDAENERSAMFASRRYLDGGYERDRNAIETERRLKEEMGDRAYKLYKQYVREIEDTKATQQMVKETKEKAKEHGLRESLKDIAVDVPASVMAFEETPRHLLFDEDKYSINTNSQLYRLQNYQKAVEEQVNQNIEDKYGEGTWQANAGKIGYGVGMSTGKMVAPMVIGGVAGSAAKGLGATEKGVKLATNLASLPQFGMSAYSSTLKESLDKGYAPKQAYKMAAVAGLAEMGTEVFSMDAFWDIARASGSKVARNQLANWLVMAGIEGSEEGANDVINEIADIAINGNQSEYYKRVDELKAQGLSDEEANNIATKEFWAQAGTDILSGSLAGGIMGGGATLVQGARTASVAKYVDAGDYMAVVESLPTEAGRYENQTGYAAANEAVELAQNLAKKAEQGETVTKKEKRTLVGLVTEARENMLEEKPQATAEARRTENEIIADISAAKNAQQLTQAYHEAVESIPAEQRETIDKMFNNKAYTLKLTDAQINAARLSDEQVREAGYNGENIGHLNPRQIEVYQEAAKEKFIESTKMEAEMTNKATAGDKEYTIQGIENLSKDNMTLQTTEGPVKLSEVQFSNKGEQALYNNAAQLGSVEAARAYVDNYVPGIPVRLYDSIAQNFYTAGQAGLNFDGLSKTQRDYWVKKADNEEGLRALYNAGKGVESKLEHSHSKKVDYAKKGEGKVIDNREEKTKTLHQGFLGQVAEKFGIDIEVVDNLAQDDNGSFNPALGKIVLNANSKKMYSTLMHELGEFAQAYNPKAMEALRVAVLEYAAGKNAEGLRKDLIAYKNAYEKVESGKTLTEASEELFNDCLGVMFESEEAVEDFVSWVMDNRSEKEAKGIINTLARWIKDFCDAIKKYLKENHHKYNATQIETMQMDVERAQELRKQILQAFDEAIATRDTMAGKTGESTTSHSLEVDTEGRKLAPRVKEYFRNSKLVDKQGRLKEMYHGTRYAGFTVFQLAQMDDGASIFLSDNPDISKTYAGTRDFYEPDRQWNFKELETAVSFATGGDWEVEKTDSGVRITELGFVDQEDVTNDFPSVAAAQDYFITEYLNKVDLKSSESAAVYRLYGNATNPLVIDAKGNNWNELEPVVPYATHYYDVEVEESKHDITITYHDEDGNVVTDSVKNYNNSSEMYKKYGITIDEETKLFENDYIYIDDIFLDKDGKRVDEYGTTRTWAKYARESGYDSVIFNNVIDSGLYAANEERFTPSTVAVVFNPNQVKSIYNQNPTENEDIRYSIDVQPERVFYTKTGTEVVQNPTSQEYSQMREDILQDRPWLRGSGEPLFRHTYDEQGNEYYWDAMGGLHSQVEPEINKKYNTRTSQQWQWWMKEDKNDYPVDYNTRFSLDVPVEESKNLIAVHNLHSTDMMDTLKLGGFPMPSIAIIKPELGHDKYGNVSVLFYKDTIDPKKNRENKVYSGDAYTPEFPQLGYKVDVDKIIEVRNRMKTLMGDQYDAFGYLGLDTDNVTDYLERNRGNVVDAFSNKEPYKYAFTQDKGIKFDLPMKESRLSLDYDNDTVKYIALMFTPEQALDSFQNSRETYEEFQKDGRLDKIIEKINAVEKKNYGKLYEKLKTTELSYRDFDQLLNAINKYHRDGVKQEVDRLAFSTAINDVINQNRAEYEQWLRDLFDGVILETGIRNQKDMFTPSGNRRNWNSLYDPYNLVNLVKAMKAEPEQGKGFGGYSIFGSANRQFESIEDIHSEEGRLQKVDEDEYSKIKDDIQNDLYELARHLKPNPDYDAYSIVSDIAEAAATRKTKSGMKSWLSQWYDVTDSDMNDIMDIVKRAAELPTGYFEAKPRRAVGFDEIASVVVPDLETDLQQALSDKNIPYVTYKAGDKESRKAAVNSVAEEKPDVRFSIEVDDEGIKYVDVNVDQERFNGLTTYEMLKEARQIIKEQYRTNYPIGEIDGTEIFGSKKSEHYTGAPRRQYTDEQNQAKYRAITELNNLFDAATFFDHNSYEDVKKQHPEAVYGISKYRTVYKVGNSFYEGLVNILNTRKKRIFYDVTKIKTISRAAETLLGNRGMRDDLYEDMLSHYKENATATDGGTKQTYSLNVDTQGRELSAEQQEFFANSKIRDNEGRLKVMYHGTPNHGFTVFDKKKAKWSGQHGRGFYFSDSKTHSGDYGDLYEVYLNIKHPVELGTHDITKEQFRKFVEAVAENEDYGLDNYGYGATVDSVVDSVWGKEDYSLLMDVNASCIGDYVEAVKLFNEVNGTDYDGIVAANETVAFEPNQIKEVTNKNPTEDEDIRHSLELDDTFGYYDLEDLQGTFLDEEGNVLPVGRPAVSAEETIKGLARYLEAANTPLKGHKVNDAALKEIAKQFKEEYQSAADTEVLVDNLRTLFNYLQTEDNIDYNEITKLLSEVSRPIIEQSGKVDETQVEQYQKFVDYVKDLNIALTDAQKKVFDVTPYGSYNNFRKAYFGTLNLTNDGIALDSVWNELAQQARGYLPLDAAEEDMGIALADALTAMKPQAESLYGYDAREASIDLAGRIMEAYYEAEQNAIKDEMLENGTAGVQAKRLIDIAREEMRREVQDLRKSSKAEYERRLEDMKGQVKQYQDAYNALAYDKKNLEKKFEKLSDKQAAQLAKAKARQKTVELQAYIDAEETKKQKVEINKIAVDLLNRATNPTTKKYMPEQLRKPIAEFLVTLDFVSHRAKADSQPTLKWQARMRELKDFLSKASDPEQSDALVTMDQDLVDDIERFADRNKDVPKVSQLKPWELKELHSILSRLRTVVNKSNEMFENAQYSNQAVFNQAAYRELREENSQKNYSQFMNSVRDFFSKSLEDPITYFTSLGPHAKSLFDEFLQGFDLRTAHIKEYAEFMKNLQKDKTEFYKWEQAKHTFNLKAGTIEMTEAQIMSLYETMKREQARGHILPSGFKVSKVNVKGKPIIQVYNTRMTPAEYSEIVSVLSDEQIAVADEIQRFMADNCAAWGNRTTMKLWGYKKFNEKHYFPIKTDANSRDANTKEVAGNAGLWSNKNMSASKELVHGAKNAIIIDDIFDVFSKHVTDMATYDGMVLPQIDAMRWFNFREIQEGEDETGHIEDLYSMKNEIQRLMGDAGTSYFTNLMLGINGMEPKSRGVQIASNLVGNYKRYAVMGKIRVMIQQPTAYVRALDEIDGKYLSKALAVNPVKYAKIAQENSMLAWWKSQGYYETMIGKGVKEMGVSKNKVAQTIEDAAGFGAQKADDLTWGVLYHAVELEIADKTELTPGTKDFTEAVVKRFEDVATKTQVVDTILHRTDIMRSNNELVKLATSFRAEPLKTYNMILRSALRVIRDPRSKEAWKKLFRSLVTFGLNAVAVSFVKSLWDAFRHDDDKTPYKDRLLAEMLGDGTVEGWLLDSNLSDDLLPTNMIPFVDQAWDIMASKILGHYYSGNDMMWQGVEQLGTTLSHVIKRLTTDEKQSKNDLGIGLEVLQTLSMLTGTPGYNFANDFIGIWNGLFTNIETKQDTSLYGELKKAVEKNDEKGIKKEVEYLQEKDKDIASTLKSYYKDSYEENRQGIEQALVETGMTQSQAKQTVDDWEEEKMYTDLGYENSEYNDVYYSIDNGGDVQKAVREMMKTKEPKNIKSALSRKYKQQLIETRDPNLKNSLIKALMELGMTRDEALEYLGKWK